jgi:translation initiation factor 2 beta subunit (eIF-2beta)/eIF-5
MDSFMNNDNLINIGGSPEDNFYRYKMPKLCTQIIGRGNGIFTNLKNIEEISKAIGHPVEIICKYITYCTGSNWNSSKKTITGKHDVESIQSYIMDYIMGFVLCEGCRNPETMFKIEGKKKNIDLYVQCASCGYMPKVIIGANKTEEQVKVIKGKNNERLYNFIPKFIKENPMELTTEKKEYHKENNVVGDDDNIF